MKFGEFLLSSRTVTCEQLLQALVTQKQNEANVVQAAVRLRILAPPAALEVLNEATRLSENLREVTTERFLEVALFSNAITSQQAEDLREFCQKSVPPLGRVLIEQGVLQESDVPILIKKFMACSASEWCRATVLASCAEQLQS
ncbi:MAG: hypothetical protein KDB22_19580 [Planctomycetales bacterium]|nr:hypothetical protein [Planctomycetales bacterium]